LRIPVTSSSEPPVQKLSIVLPAYNEVATVKQVIDAVLDVELPERIDRQLVIVESNSTDGTREAVASFVDHRITLVLQDAPRGKGNAVREGFRHVDGDIILIQDADLEYRVEDYPKLIEPIIKGDADFVLGSRHVPGESIRSVGEGRLVSSLLNGAHWVFAALFNLLYGTRLVDPFTMYKVFRTGCIRDMDFVSNRFDFDIELVAKIVRRGYLPIGIPISYKSRSFSEGKKVRFFRDPLTWLVALVRFRFEPASTG
jgi:glycosyltransferase involved in cell wall biosynthesis